MRITALITSLLLSGCSAFEFGAVYVVDSYCDIPKTERTILRYSVNSRIYPDKITIDCAELPEFIE